MIMKAKTSISQIVFYFFVLVYLAIPGSVGVAKNVSLGKLYPREDLEQILISRTKWRPFPKANERAAWLAVSEKVRNTFINLGEEYLGKNVPNLPATIYLEYKRIGNRSNYQGIWLERRRMLHCLVLAECFEGKGRFRDAISNVLWAICEESSWTWPAHIGAQKAGVDLPETTEPIVALFSAQTADSLTWTVYLLKDRIDTVSPQICKRVQHEINLRILKPYLERDDFGWMGFKSRGDGRRPNNWNPWINSNVLTASLLIEENENRRLDLVYKVLRCLDNYMVPYPPDGSCDEGPSYWGHAGASLFDNLELLYSATDGRLSLYDNSLIREIGRFIYRAHISDDYFVNIGDCHARLDIYHDLIFRYGKRINDLKMQAFATYDLTEEKLFSREKSFRSLGRILFSLFNLPTILAAKSSSQPLLRDVWLGNEDMQMMAARDKEGSSTGLYIAGWAGHNGQSHNHNDVGNFIVFVDGRPFIVDIGKPTYTRQTFSSNRYNIPAMQSAYHNLPTINGVMQEAGRRYGAGNVTYESGEKFAQIKMDIAQAYPEQAGAKSWVRTVRLNRGRNIQLVDSFKLNKKSQDVVQNFITPCEVIHKEPGTVILKDPEKQTELILQYESDKLSLEIEGIDINDESLLSIWDSRLYRILLKSKSPTGQDTWTFQFSMTNLF